MITPKTTLDNPFYFINDGVLYDIKTKNDDDGCGKHKVIYITEEKEVQAGKNYTDLHGDTKKAETLGNYQVSTGKIKEYECSLVFPYFRVKYHDNTNNRDIYECYWLQNMIKDGDKVEGTYERFVMYPGQPTNGHGGATYYDLFSNSLEEDVKKQAKNGATIERIKKSFPIYCFVPSSNPQENKTTITYEGKRIEVIYQGINDAGSFENFIKTNPEEKQFRQLDDETIWKWIYEAINELTVEFANKKLKPHGKELCADYTDIVNENTVCDIDSGSPDYGVGIRSITPSLPWESTSGGEIEFIDSITLEDVLNGALNIMVSNGTVYPGEENWNEEHWQDGEIMMDGDEVVIRVDGDALWTINSTSSTKKLTVTPKYPQIEGIYITKIERN